MSNVSAKKLSSRVATINQKMSEVLHYWKIRCDERRTLSRELLRLKSKIKHLTNLEETLKLLTNNRQFIMQRSNFHKSKISNKQFYPVFLPHNEVARLRELLSGSLHKKFVTYKRHKGLLWLSKSELVKARRLVKSKKRRKHGTTNCNK